MARSGAMGAREAGAGGSLAVRRLVPEMLDNLAPDDPRAVRSRGDLRRINAIMRQAAIADALLARHLDVPADRPLRVIELGAGDGHAMLRLARRLARRHPRAELTLLDMAPATSEATLARFAELGWTVRTVTADAFAWLAGEGTDGGETFDVALANLFLHHFEDAGLERLFALVARRARLLVATEPLRTAPSLAASRLVGLIGANAVSRHDAPASVRAGFRRTELGAIWERVGGTVLEEGARTPFTHVLCARS